MADTLRGLAGPIFREADVISAFTPPVEVVVLESYVFLPYARTGIAAALDAPFAINAPAEAAVTISVPVMDGRGSSAAEMTVKVHGPAAVTEIDPRQVIRTVPRADTAPAEVDDLVHVEFDRPDLPWLFTPTGPGPDGKLMPWITLVVAERSAITFLDRRGLTSRARIRRDQLQSLDDAWAWAHAQVMGVKADVQPEPAPTLTQRLGDSNAPYNLSRLVCPRRLDAHTAYVACVVPTFLVGRESGLGLTPTTKKLDPAWGPGDPSSMVDLPVYFSWQFATGDKGNFESLARKIHGVPAPPGIGRRRVDATRPWEPPPLTAGDPGAEQVVEGPIVSVNPVVLKKPDDPPDLDPATRWPSEEEQHWPDGVVGELVKTLDLADFQAHKLKPDPPPDAPERPLVGPPLYGGNHAQQPRIKGSTLEWFTELNKDPHNRIVAGLGTRVIQMDQEDLVAEAWNQVGDVEAANRALRLAQLAKHVSGSLHRRHLSRFRDAAVMTVTERVHPKLHETPDLSVWAAIQASSLPATVASGPFRRLSRIRGPLARTAVRDRTVRAAAVESLTVLPDRMTRDWVRVSEGPDAVRRLSPVAQALVTAEVVARVAPGVDRQELVGRLDSELARPSGTDVLTPDAVKAAAQGPMVDVSRTLGRSIIERLVATAPRLDEASADPGSAYSAANHALMLRAVVDAGGEDRFKLPSAEVKRLELEAEQDPDDPGRHLVTSDTILALAERLMAAAQQQEVPIEELGGIAGRLRELVAAESRIEPDRLSVGLAAIAERVVLDDPFVDAPRAQLDTPALQIVAKLDPAITVPARVVGRLTSGSGRKPGWLRPDWFDDGRIEPVMAHPRFHHPMYEPLDRYDREWMVPGLRLIPEPDMGTLLVTNNRFLEAYLVGLNHEMGRELLWREYPTDQRGTYFDSFWTGDRELVAEMHEAAWRDGKLSSHVKAELDGQLVFLVRAELVRRYPGVVAHAALQTDVDDNDIPVFQRESPARSIFHILLPPNVLLAGFSLTKETVEQAAQANPNKQWWFTLSENPTEPRFGLDEGPLPAVLTRDGLNWDHFHVDPGKFLNGEPSPDREFTFEDSHWGDSSASNAYLLFQLPARAAFSAVKMIAKAHG